MSDLLSREVVLSSRPEYLNPQAIDIVKGGANHENA